MHIQVPGTDVSLITFSIFNHNDVQPTDHNFKRIFCSASEYWHNSHEPYSEVHCVHSVRFIGYKTVATCKCLFTQINWKLFLPNQNALLDIFIRVVMPVMSWTIMWSPMIAWSNITWFCIKNINVKNQMLDTFETICHIMMELCMTVHFGNMKSCCLNIQKATIKL